MNKLLILIVFFSFAKTQDFNQGPYGINYFDTAPYYGYGLSEHRLGNFLKNIDRDKFILSTKVGRYMTPADPNTIDRLIFKSSLDFSPTVDYSYDGVMRSFEQSLFRLGLSAIDICLIHDVDEWTHGDKVEKKVQGGYGRRI